MSDDRLRLIFTCCHPALSTQAQVALTLRLLGGLSTMQVARAFLVAEPTMARRLVRAKHKITAARIPYRVPADHELPDRLRSVLAVVYLVYTAGLTNATDPGLCAEAIRLARILATLLPDDPEVAGLLALLLLTESRRPSRTRPDGSLVLLGDQDRTGWDKAQIQEGQAILRRCLRRDQPGPYQLQAAINAVHADASTLQQTDWPQILALYDQLLSARPDLGRGPQPGRRRGRGPRPSRRAGPGGGAGPGQLPPLPRYPSRSAAAAWPPSRGRGRLRTGRRPGAHRRRTSPPQPRRPDAALSHTVQIEQEVNHFGIWARADHCWHCIRRSSG